MKYFDSVTSNLHTQSLTPENLGTEMYHDKNKTPVIACRAEHITTALALLGLPAEGTIIQIIP